MATTPLQHPISGISPIDDAASKHHKNLETYPIMPTQILLIGAGAIGAFYAARLSTVPNTQVSVLCRSNYDAVVNANGFHIESAQRELFDDFFFRPAHVFRDADEIRQAGVKWDWIVVATKALPDVHDDSALLEGLVTDDHTAIVLIQNGIGVEEPYAKRFPRATILTAVTISSCAQPSPGVIRHNRWSKTDLGPFSHAPSSSSSSTNDDRDAKRSQHFADLLVQSGFKDTKSHTPKDIQAIRWHKTAINAGMNPSSVLSTGSTNFSLASHPELSEHVKAVMEEVFAVAAYAVNDGAPLPLKKLGLGAPDKALARVRDSGKDDGSRPSMWNDWDRGSRMELEVILGNVIKAGRKAGVEVPRVQAMYALLKAAEENREREREQKRKGKL